MLRLGAATRSEYSQPRCDSNINKTRVPIVFVAVNRCIINFGETVVSRMDSFEPIIFQKARNVQRKEKQRGKRQRERE